MTREWTAFKDEKMTREQLKTAANKVAEIMREGYYLPMTEYKVRTALNNLEAMANLIAQQDTYIDTLIDLLEDWSAIWNESDRTIDEVELYSKTMKEI